MSTHRLAPWAWTVLAILVIWAAAGIPGMIR
jgi:hypothetical protein